VWVTIGSAAHVGIDDARGKAREVIARIKAGEDRAGPKSFQTVADEWLKRHVDQRGLLSRYEIRRLLTKHVLPPWSGRDFESIKRGDVTELLNRVEDNSGQRTADSVLSVISRIFKEYTLSHEGYSSPIVTGMRRYRPKEHARSRILSDDEIRAVWSAVPIGDSYGDMVKLLLLTGQRREKVWGMRWDDISIDGTWHVPNGTREKGAGGELVLPGIAVDIICNRPRFESNPYIFAGRGAGRFTSIHEPRDKLKAKLATLGVATDWTLHDLRRTARSLMSRGGVRPDIAERVLGHVQQGVLGIYDRHGYREEKAHALKALASLIDSILSPQNAKVRQLRR
jgi:integrase